MSDRTARELRELREQMRKRGGRGGMHVDPGTGVYYGTPCTLNMIQELRISRKTQRAIEREVGNIPRWNDKRNTKQRDDGFAKIIEKNSSTVKSTVKDRKGGGVQQETEQRKQRKQQEQEVKRRQRPGGGRRSASVPRPSLRTLGVTAGVLLFIGLIGNVVASVLAALAVIAVVLKVALVVAAVGGVGYVAWHTRDAVPVERIAAWRARRSVARAAVAARRAEVAAVIEADSAPIALGPAPAVEPAVEVVSQAEHDALKAAWMPGTHVPDLAPEWRRPAKEKQ